MAFETHLYASCVYMEFGRKVCGRRKATKKVFVIQILKMLFAILLRIQKQKTAKRKKLNRKQNATTNQIMREKFEIQRNGGKTLADNS